jgi:hypothetical protein
LCGQRRNTASSASKKLSCLERTARPATPTLRQRDAPLAVAHAPRAAINQKRADGRNGRAALAIDGKGVIGTAVFLSERPVTSGPQRSASAGWLAEYDKGGHAISSSAPQAGSIYLNMLYSASLHSTNDGGLMANHVEKPLTNPTSEFPGAADRATVDAR